MIEFFTINTQPSFLETDRLNIKMSSTDKMNSPEMHGMVYSNDAAVRAFNGHSVDDLIVEMVNLLTNCRLDVTPLAVAPWAVAPDSVKGKANLEKYKIKLQNIVAACFWLWGGLLNKKDMILLLHKKLVTFTEESKKREHDCSMTRGLKRELMRIDGVFTPKSSNIHFMEFHEILEMIHQEHL